MELLEQETVKIIERSDEKYNFNIDIYEGPLDLLLHLAKTHKVEITEISVDILVQQYIEYIESVQELGINVASEYIEMAGELIRLKSKMLLPNSSEELFEELEDLGFTRDELIQKLLEYKKYKDAAEEFDKMSKAKEHQYYKLADLMKDYREENFKTSIDFDRFKLAMQNVIYKQSTKKEEIRVIELKELNVEEMMDKIKLLTEKTNFQHFIKEFNRIERVSAFLALLECVKLQQITIEVIEDEENVYLIPVKGA